MNIILQPAAQERHGLAAGDAIVLLIASTAVLLATPSILPKSDS